MPVGRVLFLLDVREIACLLAVVFLVSTMSQGNQWNFTEVHEVDPSNEQQYGVWVREPSATTSLPETFTLSFPQQWGGKSLSGTVLLLREPSGAVSLKVPIQLTRTGTCSSCNVSLVRSMAQKATCEIRYGSEMVLAVSFAVYLTRHPYQSLLRSTLDSDVARDNSFHAAHLMMLHALDRNDWQNAIVRIEELLNSDETRRDEKCRKALESLLARCEQYLQPTDGEQVNKGEDQSQGDSEPRKCFIPDDNPQQ